MTKPFSTRCSELVAKILATNYMWCFLSFVLKFIVLQWFNSNHHFVFAAELGFKEFCQLYSYRARKHQLLELTSDPGLKQELFKKSSIANFRAKLNTEYPVLSEKAIKMLLPFACSYFCESTFLQLAATTTKTRNRLDVFDALRISLSSIKRRIDKFLQECQTKGFLLINW